MGVDTSYYADNSNEMSVPIFCKKKIPCPLLITIRVKQFIYLVRSFQQRFNNTACWVKISADDILKYLSYFPRK